MLWHQQGIDKILALVYDLEEELKIEVEDEEKLVSHSK